MEAIVVDSRLEATVVDSHLEATAMDSLNEAYTVKNLLPLAELVHLGLVVHNREEPNYYLPIAVKEPFEGFSRLALVDLLDNSFKGILVVRYMDYIVPS